MAKRLLAILLVAPSIALAQTTTVSGVVTVAENADQDKVINVAECLNQTQDNLQVSWTFNAGAAGPFTVLASDQSACPQSSTTGGTITATTVTMGPSGTNNFADTQTVATRIASVFGANCPSTATTLFVCVIDTATNSIITGSILLDLAAPPAPVANTPTPGDGALNVSWSQGSGSVDGGTGAANGFRVYCDERANVPDDAALTRKCADVSGQGTTDTRIEGLRNGTEYAVEVTAVTQGGNESPHSTPRVFGTPVEIDDFWRLYRETGREQGGCAAGAGGLVALLALAPLAWRWRRRRS